jgi:hypothetical protein
MANLQAEIDATNQVYGEKLRQANIAGTSRLGQNAAISARRGLLGSDFGAAANDTVTNDNNQIYSGIGAEQAAAVAAITDKGNNLAQTEIANKNAARQQGAEEYIKFLGEQTTRQNTRAQQGAQHALQAGIDLSTLSPDDLQKVASSYGVTPNQLISNYVATRNAQATAQKSALVTAPVSDSIYAPDGQGGFTQVQQGQAQDSAIKEYQFAVTNDGYTGSLQDFISQKANAKVSVGVNPGTGAYYDRTGPAVAGTGGGGSSVSFPSGGGSPVSLPKGATPVSPSTPTVPTTGQVANPFDTLSGSDLAYAQTGDPNKAKFKYTTQIDGAEKRIRSVIPDWTPGNAAAQYSFYKSPDTQKFIANSNTVLNTIQNIKALSAKVDRSNITLLANGQLALKRATSDPDTATFIQQAGILADEIGKILGSGQGSDFTIQLGQTLVNTGYSQDTFAKTMDLLDGRVRNKVAEYISQGGQAAAGQTAGASSASQSTLPQDVQDVVTKNMTLSPDGKTAYLPRSVWSTLGANMDAVLQEAKNDGVTLLIQ